jgi:hypothetical protein
MLGSGFVRGRYWKIDRAIVVMERRGSIRFEGELSAADAAAELEPFLSSLHARLSKFGRRRLVVDVSALSWASESAVRCFVRWAMWIEGEPASRRYELVIRADAGSAWQIAAFRTLSSIAPATVRLETPRLR